MGSEKGNVKIWRRNRRPQIGKWLTTLDDFRNYLIRAA
jgi:hypothetical protein